MQDALAQFDTLVDFERARCHARGGCILSAAGKAMVIGTTGIDAVGRQRFRLRHATFRL